MKKIKSPLLIEGEEGFGVIEVVIVSPRSVIARIPSLTFLMGKQLSHIKGFDGVLHNGVLA